MPGDTYSIGIPSLLCDEIIASPNGELGETFKRFTVHPGDLFIGDRAYGVRPGIFHVAEAEGDVLVRFAMDNLPLQTRLGRPFHLLKKLRSLGPRAIGDWMVQLEHNGQTLEGRVCAIRKSRQAAEQARKDVIRQAQKSGCKPKAETLEAAGFIFVFTTLDREALTARDALEMYRGRWQIELVFKRLKSILGLGHLRKIDEQAAKAWLHGKLLVAFIIEMLICKGEAFFPLGIPALRNTMTAAVVFGVESFMLGLLRQTLCPKLVLKERIEDWLNISLMLRESSRRRQLQMEKILVKWPSLS